MPSNAIERIKHAWADHGRHFGQYQFVYPVISRRAGGISLGINLNPDLVCNFDCPYCQVERNAGAEPMPAFTTEGLRTELDHAIGHWIANKFTDSPRFEGISPEQLDLKDICMSGDGEPTLEPGFPEVCALLRELQDALPDLNLKLTLITNATLLHQEKVQAGLKILTSLRGEIWGKLDAGTEDWFRTMSRSRYKLDHIESNLCQTVQKFPLRIQTMLCTVNGAPPSHAELEAWANRISHIYQANPANLLEVQLYSIIRRTSTSEVGPVPPEFLEDVAAWLRAKIPVPVGAY
jgi:wyosine [tRNA(Phe)-imidazoG37] synthetase (radical SAM superfamily)